MPKAPETKARGGAIAAIARSATRLLPGFALGWLLFSGYAALLVPGSATAWPLCFAFGTYGIMTALVWALASPIFALVPERPGRQHPPASRIVLLGAIALVLTLVLSYALHPLADALVPTRVGRRDVVVQRGALMLASGLAPLSMVLLARWRHPKWRAPLWLAALTYSAAYAFAEPSLTVALPGRAWLFVGAGLLVFVLTMPAPSGRSGAGPGIALLATALVTLSALGSLHRERASFQREHPGAAFYVAQLRMLFDMDGDGFAAILGGPDCDDDDPDVHPATLEVVGNGIDDNCVGGDLASYEHLITGPPSPPPAGFVQRNLVLITVDALRHDALIETEDRKLAAPRLAAFAQRNASFSRAYVQVPFTDHSLRSMFTGMYPMDFDSLGKFLGQEASLAEHLRGHGYQTAAINQVFTLNPYVMMGFEHIDDSLAVENRSFTGRTSEQTTRLALTHLERMSAENRPFFLWVHYFDPHEQYLPTSGTPFEGDDDATHYWQEVWETDRHLGTLLEHIDSQARHDETVVAITGDHGELLGADGRFGHALWVDEAILRVPLVLRGPGLASGRFDTRVRLIDLAPTLLELCLGIEVPLDGTSLTPILASNEAEDRPVFARNAYRGRLIPPLLVRVAIDGDLKLVQDLLAGTEALFDLAADPGEQHNLVDERPEDLAAMRTVLGQRWDRSLNDQMARRKLALLPQRTLSPDQLEAHRIRLLRTECDQGLERACQELEAQSP